MELLSEPAPGSVIAIAPHFGSLDWDDIYADWDSEELQYYWRDLDYEVVPFEDLPVHPAGTPEELVGEYLRQEHRSDLRRRRRDETTG